MKTCLPMLSTPLGMMTSTYFFVWGEKKKISSEKVQRSDSNDLTGRFLYLQAGKTPQKPVWQTLCTVWESAPGLCLGSCLAELQGQAEIVEVDCLWRHSWTNHEGGVRLYLCGTVWRPNPCPRRASCETCPVLSVGRRPGSPRRGRRPLGKMWSSPLTYKHARC